MRQKYTKPDKTNTTAKKTKAATAQTHAQLGVSSERSRAIDAKIAAEIAADRATLAAAPAMRSLGGASDYYLCDHRVIRLPTGDLDVWTIHEPRELPGDNVMWVILSPLSCGKPWLFAPQHEEGFTIAKVIKLAVGRYLEEGGAAPTAARAQ